MSGVTFRARSTGGIGDTIAVGLVIYFDETGAGHVFNDGFWTPAKEDPTGRSTIPISGFDIFVGFTAEALDDLGFTSSLPTAHPYNLEDGSDLDSEELAELDLRLMLTMRTLKMTQPPRWRRAPTSSAWLENLAQTSR